MAKMREVRVRLSDDPSLERICSSEIDTREKKGYVEDISGMYTVRANPVTGQFSGSGTTDSSGISNTRA